MFTDTHTHPYLSEDPEAFVRRAVAAGVDRLIVPAVNYESVAAMEKLAASFPENVRLAFGLHPTEVNDTIDIEKEIKDIFTALDRNEKTVAVGEIGIDLYWDKTFREMQMQVFDRQTAEAIRRNLPIIIHCREAHDEVLEVLEGHRDVRAVFHSFGGKVEQAEKILGRSDDFYIGINGIVTFKNSKLKDVIPAVPRDRILLETDSPYLAPVPHRGHPNESAWLPFVASAVADFYGTGVEEVADLTRQNSVRLFGF